MWYKNKFIVCIGRLPKKLAIAIPSLALLTTEAQPAHYVISTKGAARVEKSQKMNTVEISPCVPFGHLVEMTMVLFLRRKPQRCAPAHHLSRCKATHNCNRRRNHRLITHRSRFPRCGAGAPAYNILCARIYYIYKFQFAAAKFLQKYRF